MVQTIAIIGAGFAGVSTAKLLNAQGYQVTVFEKEAEAGGVWTTSRRYPGLSTQNPRDTYALSDFPMPEDYPEWPSGEQVQKYFEAYLDHFNIRHLFRFNTQVLNADYCAQTHQWRLTTEHSGSGAADTTNFDFLIVCNGIFSIPTIPNFEGLDAWQQAGGKIVHTSQFNNIEDARGKNVVVIGYGKSSCDAAYATLTASKSTTVVARSLLWKIPKKIGGVLNFKHLFLNRMGEGLFPYIELRGFEKFLHGVGKPLRNSMLGSVREIIAAQFKLSKVGLHPRKPIESIARSTVSLVTPGFFEAVKQGRMKVETNTQIVSLRPGEAELANGHVIPADFIVAGTGWDQRASFFPPEILSKVTAPDGDFRLYRTMLPVGVPQLAFNGYNSSFFSQLSCEVGAMWIAEYLRGAIDLPSVDEQNREIDKRLKWMRARTNNKHCKGTNIVPFSIHHIDELLDEIDLNITPKEKLMQWLKVLDPSVYAKNYDILAERLAKSRRSQAQKPPHIAPVPDQNPDHEKEQEYALS